MLNSMFLKTDLWTILINAFVNWIGNYGWAIILFTVSLKLLMSPLDVMQRSASSKQTKVMAIMQPEMQALQAKYANDRSRLNAEQAKLYKKYNVGIGGICGPLLISLAVSLIVIFSLYGSLRAYGNEKLYSTYHELDVACEETHLLDSKTYSELTEEELTTLEVTIKDKYTEISDKNSWLWVKNVWKSDTNVSQFVSFNDYSKNQKFTDEEKVKAKERYDAIVSTIEGKDHVQNGYYVLMILCALTSFLTQFISTKLMTPKGQKLNKMNLIMFAVIPVTMLILAMTSNVVFTLYIIINSIMATLISTVISLVLKKKNKGGDDNILFKKKNVEVVEYSRNYKK